MLPVCGRCVSGVWSLCGWCVAGVNAHLSLLDSHRLASRRRLLVDAGQEVLRDPQGVLQKRVVRVAGGGVFE